MIQTYFELVLAEAYNSNRIFDIIDKTEHDIDHPISFKEGAYLKTIYLQMHYSKKAKNYWYY